MALMVLAFEGPACSEAIVRQPQSLRVLFENKQLAMDCATCNAARALRDV